MKLLTIIGALTVASSACAGEAWEFDAAGTHERHQDYETAAVFTLNAPELLTALGFYMGDHGSYQRHPISLALYACSDLACSGPATLIASASIGDGEPSYRIDNFQYAALSTPISLQTHGGYEIAGLVTEGFYTRDDGGFATDPAVHYEGTVTAQSATPGFLHGGVFGGDADGPWGPNLYFGAIPFGTPVPEPGAWVFMLVGLGMIGAARRLNSRSCACWPSRC